MTTRSNYIFYSDNFALAAKSGLRRSQSIAKAFIATIIADPATVVVPVEFDSGKRNLSRAFDLAYESLFLDGQSLTPLQRSFTGLAEYILLKTASTVDSYLTNEGLQVDSTYAQIHNILDETSISSGNVR